jgi:hypothetical protein
MTYPVTDVNDIKAMHYGCTNVLHIVGYLPVCAPCARAAFRTGLAVEVGEFAEGEPIECECSECDDHHGICGRKVYSTYGRV